MSQGYIRPELLYGWHGRSLLVVSTRGDCAEAQALSGFYFRETRYLRTLRLTLNGTAPWLSQAAAENPAVLHFDYVHPEMRTLGGGRSGQSGDTVETDEHGTPYRALDVRWHCDFDGHDAHRLLRGDSPRGIPNMIATMWLGGAADGGLGVPPMIGMVTHMATSGLMGIVAVPFVAVLPRWRVLLVSLAYALASYPLVFSLVMRWANPLMYERAPMFDMTWGHAVFGVTFAVAFLWIGGRRDRGKMALTHASPAPPA